MGAGSYPRIFFPSECLFTDLKYDLNLILSNLYPFNNLGQQHLLQMRIRLHKLLFPVWYDLREFVNITVVRLYRLILLFFLLQQPSEPFFLLFFLL